MMSFRGHTSSAKMTSPGSKLIALVCYPTKRVNKAEELNISLYRRCTKTLKMYFLIFVDPIF
jgi:hypothetical protein